MENEEKVFRAAGSVSRLAESLVSSFEDARYIKLLEELYLGVIGLPCYHKDDNSFSPLERVSFAIEGGTEELRALHVTHFRQIVRNIGLNVNLKVLTDEQRFIIFAAALGHDVLEDMEKKGLDGKAALGKLLKHLQVVNNTGADSRNLPDLDIEAIEQINLVVEILTHESPIDGSSGYAARFESLLSEDLEIICDTLRDFNIREFEKSDLLFIAETACHIKAFDIINNRQTPQKNFARIIHDVIEKNPGSTGVMEAGVKLKKMEQKARRYAQFLARYILRHFDGDINRIQLETCQSNLFFISPADETVELPPIKSLPDEIRASDALMEYAPDVQFLDKLQYWLNYYAQQAKDQTQLQ